MPESAERGRGCHPGWAHKGNRRSGHAPWAGEVLQDGRRLGAGVHAGVHFGEETAPRRETPISTEATIAALVSIVASLWIGLALLMGVRSGERLPVPASRRARLGFGVLTFLVWYAAMLSGLSLVAMLTVRTVHDVGLMVVAMLTATALLLWLRRLFRRVVLPDAQAALGAGRPESP